MSDEPTNIIDIRPLLAQQNPEYVTRQAFYEALAQVIAPTPNENPVP